MRSEMPLTGVKVLDFTWAFAGPLMCAYLADFGAEVIKVENRKRPDILRLTVPYKDGIAGLDRSGSFLVANNSKRSITLNLNHPKGIEVVKKLVAWADVVAENFQPGTMAKWGLDYENLRKIRPDLIMVSASIQGQTGPHAAFMGYGTSTIALAGIAHLTGWPDRPPVGTFTAYPDSIVPWIGVIAILAALEHRRETSKGQYIDVTQYETTLHFLAPALLDFLVNGRDQLRMGNRCPHAAPHGVYPCKGDDRWCAIAVFNEEEWKAFCRTLDFPQWASNSKFATLELRKKNEDELDSLIAAWTINCEAEEVMKRMQQNGVAAGVAKTNKDLFEDPQLAHRNFFRLLDHAEMGKCYHQAWPIILSDAPAQVSPAPCMGQDNEYVYCKVLGLSDEEFVTFLGEGVFE